MVLKHGYRLQQKLMDAIFGSITFGVVGLGRLAPMLAPGILAPEAMAQEIELPTRTEPTTFLDWCH